MYQASGQLFQLPAASPGRAAAALLSAARLLPNGTLLILATLLLSLLPAQVSPLLQAAVPVSATLQCAAITSPDGGPDAAPDTEDVLPAADTDAEVESPQPADDVVQPAAPAGQDDPLQSYNDALWNSIQMPRRGARAHVAVIDGPVRADHPDLPRVVHLQPQLRQPDGRCAGGDCCPRNAGPTAYAASWHATRVAGLIGAVRENGRGIAGLAEVGELVSIDAHLGGPDPELRLVAALYCAIDYRGADGQPLRVVNISQGLQGPPRSDALRTALQAASDAGLLIVASAGNRGSDIRRVPRWPASFNSPQMITVEARRYDGALSKNSNYGFGTVDIGAPAPEADEGPPLCSTNAGRALADKSGCSGDYAAFDRTSAAAAVVSGAAALVWRDPRYAGCSAAGLRRVLLQSRQHCRYGRDPADPPVCLLDLSFLSDPYNTGPGALCND